jgi:hypothetical protein
MADFVEVADSVAKEGVFMHPLIDCASKAWHVEVCMTVLPAVVCTCGRYILEFKEAS